LAPPRPPKPQNIWVIA